MAMLKLIAKKAVSGAAASEMEVELPPTATVGDLASRLAASEGCEASALTLISAGKPLKLPEYPLQPLQDAAGEGGTVVVVYLVRKPKPTEGAAAAPAPTPAAAPAASSAAAAPAVVIPASAAPAALGRRVLLLVRHGQCCHEGEADNAKALTAHGHMQAEETAKFIASLFEFNKVPGRRALLNSTSRRAKETAAKLPQHLPGIEVWNADMLRETDPTSNPMRAEDVFMRLFAAPAADEADTLVVVAHNNIILYWLMRAANIPIEQAAQAWALFHLRHASITRVEVASTGERKVVSIGAAGHIPDTIATWNNIKGEDMSAWKGGGPERKKFSGRMCILVRQASPDDAGVGGGSGGAAAAAQQVEAVTAHVKSLGGYMVSSHVTVACTTGARTTAVPIARALRTAPLVFPESISEQPEAAFLQFMCPPERGRDTVVMIAEEGPVLYWLLRSLRMSPDEVQASIGAYAVHHASVTLVNVRADGSMKVVTVGDTGHLPLGLLAA